MQTTLQHYDFQIHSSIGPHVFVENPEHIFIGEGVIIEPGAFIRGPCVLERGVVIRHGAYIRGNVWIGKDSIVGHCSELKNVLVGTKTRLAHFIYAADSVIGSYVNLASHVALANRRLDAANVLPMQKAKFGSVIGDRVQVGCHVVLNPGKQIEPNNKIYSKQHLVIEE
ncbi:MAG: LpxA family transferase [Chlamydiia bacterium]